MPHRQSSPSHEEPREKVCASCGRTMQWRAKWAKNWDDVKYCSDACRRRGVNTVDQQLEVAIGRLLAETTDPVTPGSAAREVAPDDWQSLSEPSRRAARRLAHRGDVVIVQGGRVVDPSSVRGPFTIRSAKQPPGVREGRR